MGVAWLQPLGSPFITKLSRIPSTAAIGSVVGRVRALAGSHVIKYNIPDHRFDIDSWGNVILTGQLVPEGSHDIVVTASTPFRNATTLLKIVVTANSHTGENVFMIEVRISLKKLLIAVKFIFMIFFSTCTGAVNNSSYEFFRKTPPPK